MALPIDYYGDPALVLERKHEQEHSCRVCIYHLRRGARCLLNRPEYPDTGVHCPRWKHNDTGEKRG